MSAFPLKADIRGFVLSLGASALKKRSEQIFKYHKTNWG